MGNDFVSGSNGVGGITRDELDLHKALFQEEDAYQIQRGNTIKKSVVLVFWRGSLTEFQCVIPFREWIRRTVAGFEADAKRRQNAGQRAGSSCRWSTTPRALFFERGVPLAIPPCQASRRLDLLRCRDMFDATEESRPGRQVCPPKLAEDVW
jgi:hypothetical protein